MYNNTKFTTVEEAQEFVDKKAEELTPTIGSKVYPILFVENEEPLDIAYGFLKTPMRKTKMVALEMIQRGETMSAGEYLLKSCLIPSESDPRIGSEDPNWDSINIGAFGSVTKVVDFKVDIAKKK